MSNPAVPSFGDAVMAVVRLQWKRQLRSKKVPLGIVAVVLILAGIIATRYAASTVEPVKVLEGGFRLGFFDLLVFLVPFLFTSGAIAEEVESRTFPFLVSRPVGRATIALGKYIAGVGMAAGLLVAGVIVLHVGCFLTEPTLIVDQLGTSARMAGAVVLIAACYGAICMFWGALAVEASGIVSTLYLAVIEFLFSFVPGPIRFVSMNYLASQVAGLPKGGLFPEMVPEVSAGICAAVVAGVTMLFLFFATLVVQNSEYRFGKA